MRRSVAHWAFGAIAMACAAIVGHQALQLREGERINSAIASARVTDFDASIPQARFARALALGRTGELEAALKTYKSLYTERSGDLRQRALYNVGNLYMRNAFAHQADPAQLLPLVELAKQSYRELLRLEPADWDARFNLEVALRLAPEVEPEIEVEDEPLEREQSTSTLQGARIDLP